MKRARIDDKNFSNAKSNGKGRQRFKRKFFNQVSSSASPMVNMDKVSNPKAQGGYDKGTTMIKLMQNVGSNMMVNV